MQHRMQHVNPFVRIRLAHPKELSLYLLNGMLFQVGQNEEQLVGERGQRTGVIGTVAPTRAGLPIKRAVLQIGRQRVLEMRQQRGKFWLS
jgi:hypothetical protein